MPKINISKLDAALRQLKTAIRIFINNGDPVSTHTLASAAQEILETLAKEQGIKSQRLQTLDMVREGYRAEVERALNSPKNFFKHADRDPKDTLSFDPKSTDFVLWDGVQLYISLTNEKIPLLSIYILWIQAKYPNIFIFTPEYKELQNNLFYGLDPENRTHFFKTLLPAAEDAYNTQFTT